MRKLAHHGLLPRSRVARFTLYLAGLELLLLLVEYALKLFGSPIAGEALSGWTGFLGFVLCLLAAFLFLRWFRRHAMWRLRNRLIVTYVFIGGVPITLLVLMVAISGYVLTGQFATFLTLSEFRSQLQRLEAANVATAQDIARSGSSVTQEGINPDDNVFPGRVVSVNQGAGLPKWLDNKDFSGLVYDDGHVFLRAAKRVSWRDKRVAVISSVAIDRPFLQKIADKVGSLDLYVPKEDAENVTSSSSGGKNKTNITINGKPVEPVSGSSPENTQGPWNRDGFVYYSLVKLTNWDDGDSRSILLTGTTRISTLYSNLSSSVLEWAGTIRIILTILAVTFGLMMIVAWFIGIRLTRTITRSVANLYEATQHINRGDFSHRIQVKEKDQLSTLQVAFNSMTESVEKLIVERQEKERLQSEISIAQEVQAQLFPTDASSTRTLELHGICRPARMVSGDYYDFLPYGSEQIGVAVGDISGKGISAALLMATIHSAVRAYEQEQLVTVSARSPLGENARQSGALGLAIRHAPPQSPSQVLWLLNRQLYKTTPPEKYATLFLGFYDGNSRRITYSNAGHLPPLILGQDGSVRRLHEGGTVVGLFDNVEYHETTVDLSPGDIFVAFSDGITEPENEFGEFGEERLIETIVAHRHLSLERITENVLAAVVDWIGSTEQPDDITLVLARPRE